MRTWATLGGVKFELAAAEQFDETVSWEYKEQETVADKAVIQFAGAKPGTLSIMARLHSSFCKPEARVQEFKDKAKKIAPLPLILANGKLVGFFVIEEIQTKYVQTDESANVISMELALKLKEAAGTAQVSEAPAQSKATAVKKAGAAAKGAAKASNKKPTPDEVRALALKNLQQKDKLNTINQVLRRNP